MRLPTLSLILLTACAGRTPTVPAPAPPPVTARTSDPAAVRLPSFAQRSCPIAAGADTAAINAAIAGCNSQGGGTVTFAPGIYSVGSIHLMSNVRLALNGATLRSNGEIDEAEPYTIPFACQDEGHRHWHDALLWGENLENIAIVGPGTLDGAGLDRNLQKMIALKSSKVMLFEGFDQVNTGHFGYLLTDCHHITMARLQMRPSRDGVDLMECTNVHAHHLTITGGPDDAFALKNDCAMGKPLVTDNVTVRDSVLGSGCTALQIGSETWGDFQNISWSNITVVDGGKSGIGLQTNDGAVIRNVSYENIVLKGTSFPIFINATSLLRGPTKVPGHVENIRFRNIVASELRAGNNRSPHNTAIVISGAAGLPHRNVVLEDVQITFPGGGAPSADPPEASLLTGKSQYNPRFLTPIPAYGLFLRHARGVELRGVKLGYAAADQRPAVIARDVDGLVIDAFGAQRELGPHLELDGIKNLTIKGSAPLPETSAPAVAKLTL
jgi:hypothetical protein